MIRSIKKFAYNKLGMEKYLRLLQHAYLLMYDLQILRLSPEYEYHYFDKKLINEGDTVIDIGANLGYYSILFSRWTGSRGKVYAVEPIQLYNKVFKDFTRGRGNITLLPYALGSEEKKIILVTSSRSGYFNTGLPHVYDSERDGDPDSHEFKFEAQMVSPKKLFADQEQINYIKCDIEGLEYIVLSEMKDIIDKHKPKVQVEVWSDNKENVMKLFADLEYIPYKLVDGKLTSDKKLTENKQGDFIFIHYKQAP